MTGFVLVLLLAAAVYSPTLAATFHFDDYSILADPAITASDGWWRVFRLIQTRPLTYFTFWLNYRLGGPEPWGYHAVNVVLHLATAAALGTVLRRKIGDRAALPATLVFALHPLQTEAVAYVFARATVLAAFLCVLAWRAWTCGRRWRAAGWFCLALLAKEECAAFPLFLLLLERRNALKPAWTAMLGASVAAGIRLLWVAARTPGSGVGSTGSWDYLYAQTVVVWKYIFLVLVPAGQNFDHHIRVSASLLPAAGLAALVGLACWKPRAGVWFLGFLVLLAPTSSFFPLADFMFEHRTYLPMISLAAGAGLVLARLPKPILPLLAVALAVSSWMRVRVWQTEETLWADAVAKSPAKVRPKLQLARAVMRDDPGRAKLLLIDAQQLEPNNPEAYTQMGILLMEQREPLAALAEFDEALRLNPASADAYSNRGSALYLLGRLPDAQDAFRRALELDPAHVNARRNLALIQR